MEESKPTIKDTWARPSGIQGGGFSFMSQPAPRAKRPGDLFRIAEEEQASKAAAEKNAENKPK